MPDPYGRGGAGGTCATTRVEFTLTPTEAGTRLRLVHRNLPPDQAGADVS